MRNSYDTDPNVAQRIAQRLAPLVAVVALASCDLDSQGVEPIGSYEVAEYASIEDGIAALEELEEEYASFQDEAENPTREEMVGAVEGLLTETVEEMAGRIEDLTIFLEENFDYSEPHPELESGYRLDYVTSYTSDEGDQTFSITTNRISEGFESDDGYRVPPSEASENISLTKYVDGEVKISYTKRYSDERLSGSQARTIIISSDSLQTTLYVPEQELSSSGEVLESAVYHYDFDKDEVSHRDLPRVTDSVEELLEHMEEFEELR